MTKKHEMSEHEYVIYKKQHDYEHAVESEQAKIKREKASYAQQSRQSDSSVRQKLRSVTNPEYLEVLEETLELPEVEYAAVRVLRNARTHKRRLVGLRKHESNGASREEE
jgi:hypothetical protein